MNKENIDERMNELELKQWAQESLMAKINEKKKRFKHTCERKIAQYKQQREEYVKKCDLLNQIIDRAENDIQSEKEFLNDLRKEKVIENDEDVKKFETMGRHILDTLPPLRNELIERKQTIASAKQDIARFHAMVQQQAEKNLLSIDKLNQDIDELRESKMLDWTVMDYLHQSTEENKYLGVMKLGLILVVVRIRGPPEPETKFMENDKKCHEEPRISRSYQLTPYEKSRILKMRPSSAKRALNFIPGGAEAIKPKPAGSLEDLIEGIDTILIPKNAQKTLEKKERIMQAHYYKRADLLKFKFNMIYDRTQTQQQIFDFVNQRFACVKTGGNACIIAYGQTGSGKTFTMEGGSRPDQKGIIPRVLEDLISSYHIEKSERFEEKKELTQVCTISVQVLEVYLDSVNDLLNPSNTSKKVDLSKFRPGELEITCKQDVTLLMDRIKKNRKTSDNTFNKSSSRSHCFLKLFLRQKFFIDQGNPKAGTKIQESLLTLVDLAGSEKWSNEKSKVASKQAAAINQSLSALTSVIQALPSITTQVQNSGAKPKRIPYKDSLLTQLLQDSMKPGACVSLIINVRPEVEQIGETLSSLRFGADASKCVI